MTRTILLRVFGLAMAAAFVVAAIALLSYGLDAGVGLRDWLASMAVSIASPIQEGEAALIGSLLGLIALVTGYYMLRRPTPKKQQLSKTREGVTELSLSGLSHVVQRRLRSQVDQGINVIQGRGRSLTAYVPTYGGSGLLDAVEETAIALPSVLESLGVEIKHRVITGAPSKSRVR